MKNLKDAKKSYIPLFFFAAGVILRFALGYYIKTPTVYWDELKYYGLARSIFQGSGFMVRNTATNFQKILYPLFLSPFFAIDDPAVRVRMITLLNAVLMNSCVFPLWIICNKLGVSKPRKIWLSALLIIWPDMLMTETFMSENLYWPLFFWYITLHFFSPKDKPLLYGLCEGTVIYLGYLCKEIFAAVLPVTAICLLLELKLCPREKGEYRREWKRLVCSATVAGLLFALGKFTIFSGMGNGYNQTDITALLVEFASIYLVYSALYLLVSVLLSTFILPIAIPIIRFRRMTHEQRQFFLYILTFITLIALGVAYTISIREDLGSMVPRLHLRYFAPAVFLLLPVFAVCPKRSENLKRDTELSVLLIFTIFIILLFRDSDATGVDQMTLRWISGLKSLLSGKFQTDTLAFWILQVAGIAFMLGIVIGIFMFFSEQKKNFVEPFFIAILVPTLLSNMIGHSAIRENYSYSTYHWDSVCKLSEEFSKLDGNILYLTENCDQNRHSRTWDCCFESVEKMYYYVCSDINLVDEEFVLEDGIYRKPDFDPDAKTSSFTFSGYVDKGYFSKTDHIDYVVIPAEAKLEPKDDTCYEIIPSLSDEYYAVYRNKDPEKLNLANIVYIGESD